MGTERVAYGSEVVRDPGVQHLLNRVFGSPAAEAAAWLADHIRYRRLKTQLRMWERASEMLQDAGRDVVPGGAVNLAVIVPLLESGSLQDDESLADRWAALLAAAVSDPDGVPPSYPEILRQMTPREAAILDGIFNQAGQHWPDAAYEPGVIAQQQGYPVARVILAAENLMRLRLVKDSGTIKGDTKVKLTHLGYDFVLRCRPPTRPES